jgi:hypothetical protein
MNESANELAAILQNEVSAVDTYDRLIHRLSDGQLKSTLEQYRDAHVRRVKKMCDRLGLNETQSDIQPWSTFTGPLGDYQMLEVLENGERHVLDDYSNLCGKLDKPEQEFVSHELLPDQQRIVRTISELHREIEEKDQLDYPWV